MQAQAPPREQMLSRSFVVMSVMLLSSWAYIYHLHSQPSTPSFSTSFTLAQEQSASLLHSSGGRALKQAQSIGSNVSTIPMYFVYQDIKLQKPGPGYWAPPASRSDFGMLLDALGGFKVGVELGAGRGDFTQWLLHTWTSCEKFYVQDLWDLVEDSAAGLMKKEQEQALMHAKNLLMQYEKKVEFVRATPKDAVEKIPSGIDFLFINTQRNYCETYEALISYWPKVNKGGVMAGLNYLSAHDMSKYADRDWSWHCKNGTKHHGGIMGAVNLFAMEQGLVVSVTYHEPNNHRSWIIRKTA